ncbi:TPA: ABC transporter substrate-binding protein [Streptococcus suis]
MGFRNILVGAVVFLSAVTLVACGSNSSESESVKVGIIQYAEHDALTASREGFIEALAEADYIEGENLTIDYQNAQGDQANLQTMVTQFVGENNLNYAIATPAAQALLNVDSETPAVFAAVAAPVEAGIVESFESPGGNITGASNVSNTAEQIEMLLKVVPDAEKVGIFYNSSEVNSEIQAQRAIKALEEKGVTPVVKTVTSTNDVQQVMTSLASQVDAVYFPTDNTVSSTAATIEEVLKEAKVPAIGSDKAILDAVLFTYSVDYHALGKQAGNLAVKILEGADPSDLPVETPAEASIAINEETAGILGIDVSSIETVISE